MLPHRKEAKLFEEKLKNKQSGVDSEAKAWTLCQTETPSA